MRSKEFSHTLLVFIIYYRNRSYLETESFCLHQRENTLRLRVDIMEAQGGRENVRVSDFIASV